MGVRRRASHGDRSRALLRRYQLLEPLLPGGSAKAQWVRWDPTANGDVGGYVADGAEVTVWSFASARDSAGARVDVYGVETQVGGQGYAVHMHDRARWEVIEAPPGPMLFGPYSLAQTTLPASFVSNAPSTLLTWDLPPEAAGSLALVGTWEILLCASVGSNLQNPPYAAGASITVGVELGNPTTLIEVASVTRTLPIYTLSSDVDADTVTINGTPSENMFVRGSSYQDYPATGALTAAIRWDGVDYHAVDFWVEAQVWLRYWRYE